METNTQPATVNDPIDALVAEPTSAISVRRAVRIVQSARRVERVLASPVGSVRRAGTARIATHPARRADERSHVHVPRPSATAAPWYCCAAA